MIASPLAALTVLTGVAAGAKAAEDHMAVRHFLCLRFPGFAATFAWLCRRIG